MIARTWAGRTQAKDADAYLDYLRRTGLAGFGETPGNQGGWILRRQRGEIAEFLVISMWDSTESMVAFSGEDAEKARYFPEDSRYLLEMPSKVDLFEVAAQVEAKP